MRGKSIPRRSKVSTVCFSGDVAESRPRHRRLLGGARVRRRLHLARDPLRPAELVREERDLRPELLRLPQGASINDNRKIFGFFDPLPTCLHLELIYAIKFTQPSLLRLLFHDTPSPSDADIISGGSLSGRHCAPSL